MIPIEDLVEWAAEAAYGVGWESLHEDDKALYLEEAAAAVAAIAPLLWEAGCNVGRNSPANFKPRNPYLP